jgi:bifunctional ADP-heptose synthase (sugar kinase/adenylyltransferase)
MDYEKIIKQFEKLKILVIGDIMLDIYIISVIPKIIDYLLKHQTRLCV